MKRQSGSRLAIHSAFHFAYLPVFLTASRPAIRPIVARLLVLDVAQSWVALVAVHLPWAVAVAVRFLAADVTHLLKVADVTHLLEVADVVRPLVADVTHLLAAAAKVVVPDKV